MLAFFDDELSLGSGRRGMFGAGLEGGIQQSFLMMAIDEPGLRPRSNVSVASIQFYGTVVH